MSPSSDYCVRAVHCDHRASDEEVYQALKRASAPLDRSWAKIKAARRITVKFNQAWEPDRLRHFEGNLQEHVDYKVARATLRLLRENNPSAEILCVEIYSHRQPQYTREQVITLLPVLREFGVPDVDGNVPPLKDFKVSGGGLMFDQYRLHECVGNTDAFVSVQKIKNHVFMGVTLTLKNLFGLPPTEPHGRARQYFHHLIRLPYVLVDLGRIVQPALCILDGLTGQARAEWGGEGRICNTLVAGDHVIATDACGTYLMGHNPLGDWPHQPFLRDRNAILIASQSGFGTAKLEEIDFQSEVQAPIAEFGVRETDPYETVLAWRRSTCEQALYYRDNMKKFVDQYAGEYILLQDYEVKWHDKVSELGRSRRELAGARRESAMWLKLVDPDELEGEHFEVYERTLAQLKAQN